MRRMILRVFLDSSRGMQNVYIGLVLLFLSLLRITLEIYPTVAVIEDRNAFPLWEYFIGNLLPEMSGMVIEVLLFLFVIDVIREVERSRVENEQKNLDFQRKVKIERRLRHQLRILIRRIFEDVEIEHDETCAEFKFHADKYIENQILFVLLGAKIAEESVDSHFYEEAKKLAGFELDLLMAVTQLCTELSYDHMKTWMNILFFLKRVSIGQNVDESTVALVKNISDFEKHSRALGYDAKI
ncbi:hypothetical protein N2L37_000367 [Vibrio cholerae]|nr:hypothetical protein [Vibrio cholerae]EGR0939139.1 hypothetical protein [Vibrio cholerae]EIA0769841.1 hypothetical protein [Vibrio cholerae]EID0160666.1 hypothetical protein [Vibrio cholerae]EJL6350352.1 hypothetical protein [Vibrio cholerae]